MQGSLDQLPSVIARRLSERRHSGVNSWSRQPPSSPPSSSSRTSAAVIRRRSTKTTAESALPVDQHAPSTVPTWPLWDVTVPVDSYKVKHLGTRYRTRRREERGKYYWRVGPSVATGVHSPPPLGTGSSKLPPNKNQRKMLDRPTRPDMSSLWFCVTAVVPFRSSLVSPSVEWRQTTPLDTRQFLRLYLCFFLHNFLCLSFLIGSRNSGRRILFFIVWLTYTAWLWFGVGS